MRRIIVKFRDGTERVFRHEGRAGGSYTKKLSYEPGFIVITDEWYNTISFPSDLVESVRVELE